jgi:hypothetical protein
MTKYTRLTGKVFGSSATATGNDPEIGQFGSALAGTYNGTTDVSIIQSLPAWQKGFISAVTPNTQFPPLPEMTGFGKVLSQQICYLLQQGVAEWDSGTTYYENNWCAYQGKLYISKSDENLNNLPTNITYWSQFTGSSSRELGEIVTSSLPITNPIYHLADGSQLSQQNYPEFLSYISEVYNEYGDKNFTPAVQNSTLDDYSDWWDIAYGNGRFVAIANNLQGTITTGITAVSTDGINWTNYQDTTSPRYSFGTITYGNGIFLANRRYQFFSSTDGINWTSISDVAPDTIDSVVYTGDRFVAVFSNSDVNVSTDGITWVRKPSATFDNMDWRLAANGTTIIALGTERRSQTGSSLGCKVSTDDGETWTDGNVSNLTGHYWKAITYDSTQFIAISSDGYISTSANGLTWTNPVYNSNLGNNSWRCLAYGNSKLVAVGSTGYVSTKEKAEGIFTSEANWQAIYTTYGECGLYVYNPTANTVRLPLYASYFTNTSNPDNVGTLTPASIPNIKGIIPASEKLYKSGTTVSDYGAFRDYAENTVSGQSDNSHFDNDLWDFDASRVSSVYSDTATTVNTQSIKQLVYIVVAK